MAVAGINLARVSNNLRAFNLLESLRLNQAAMFRVQNNLSTGLRFLQPSDDPVRAADASKLDGRLAWMSQVQSNLARANATLNETDSVMQEVINLANEARALAVQAVGDSLSPEERRALAPVMDSLLSQMVSLANRKHLNTYLFSGHQTGAPFVLDQGGVRYLGDGNRMEAVVDTDQSVDAFTIPGLEFFGAVSAQVRGSVDLDPALTRETRIVDLRGALGRGVTLGRVRVSVGGWQSEIDLRGAATVGDLVDKLNAGLPPGVTASVGQRGIVLTNANDTGLPLTIAEVGGGRTAADLGLSGSIDVGIQPLADLNPRLTGLTRLADLKAGAGLDLSGGLVIRNGGQTATIVLNDVQTVEELLNRINYAGVGVWARIADDGNTLEVRSRVSGVDLFIEENGGSAATALGLRSLAAGTPLASLNSGRGVQTVSGHDLRITTASGATFDIDLDGATTVQEVLDRLNAAAGGAYSAGLVSRGNGLRITDNTTGGGTLSIQALNDSPALMDLGLDVPASGRELTGRDVNPQRVDSPFTALLELRSGLSSDDRTALTVGAQRLERVLTTMQEVQGQMASRAKMMAARAERVEAEVTATQVLLSDTTDVDIADAAVRFQQLQTALTANLSTALKVLNLSVLDYLT